MKKLVKKTLNSLVEITIYTSSVDFYMFDRQSQMKRLAIIINVQTPLVLKSSLYTIDLKVYRDHSSYLCSLKQWYSYCLDCLVSSNVCWRTPLFYPNPLWSLHQKCSFFAQGNMENFIRTQWGMHGRHLDSWTGPTTNKCHAWNNNDNLRIILHTHIF